MYTAISIFSLCKRSGDLFVEGVEDHPMIFQHLTEGYARG